MPALHPARWNRCVALVCLLPVAVGLAAGSEHAPSLILHNGKVVTVDSHFTCASAIAVRDGRVLRTGSDREILASRGRSTIVRDLHGKMVLPGLIDSHTHPSDASMTEFDHVIPEMHGIADVLAYLRRRTAVTPKGEWIQLRQVFITRLREQRYPTRAELDEAAPDHPVLFATGPDASLNSRALADSGIGAEFRPPDGGSGKVELDPSSGMPTGILRNLTRFVKPKTSAAPPSEADRVRRLLALLRDYLANGITTIGDRDADATEIDRYRGLNAGRRLPMRVAISQHVDTTGPWEPIAAAIDGIASDPLRRPDPFLRIIGVKTYLDGGMLTGSAYMMKPWGLSSIYAITDPEYRGIRFIPQDRLEALVRRTASHGMQFTAHSVGDGAVSALLDAYEAVDRELPIRATRPTITHANFQSAESVARMSRLGVGVDIQPAWLYLDTRTLVRQFGYERLRWFQPLRSLFAAGVVAGGGSDHMQKIGARRAVNPYDPFLGMWVTLTRGAREYAGRLHPEEALTREQAIRFYTQNSARILCRDDVGSLEPGKWADMVVLDRDLLRCPVDQVRATRVMETWVGGHRVHAAPPIKGVRDDARRSR